MHAVQLVAPEEVEASVIAEAESSAVAREAERVEKLRGRYERDVEKARTALNRAFSAALVDPQKVETARAKLQAAETQLRMLGEEGKGSGEVLQRVADEDEGDRAVRMGEATPFAAAASASAVAAPQRVARPKMQAPAAAGGQGKRRLKPLGKEKKRRRADGSDDDGDDGEYDPDKDSGEDDVELYEPVQSSDGENGIKKDEVDEEGEGEGADAAEEEEESGVDVTFEGGFSVPERLYERLFAYQQVGLRWLWELHRQRTGGIVADEMGLGKTIQIIAFLGGLHHSKLLNAPVLVVCPATVLRQWARECSVWWPRFLASGMHPSLGAAAAPLIALRDPDFMRVGRLVITTYECVRQNEELFLATRWHYVILDEGHRIRNPNAETTLTCKQFATPHRLLLTGAPVQNNLRELWSLFDFIFPGKLGTLPVFETEFGLPIALGGYSNASPSQLHTAYRCASALRDIIRPYLLRRMKADVNARLPKKTEQVLFCSLTDAQRSEYRDYVRGPDISAALAGRMHALKAIDHLRKVCNHPHLLLGAGAAAMFDHGDMEEEYGAAEMSGKMQVLKQLLPLWREQGHRALLFSQTRQMLDILERLTRSLGLSYRRMDGNTAIGTRMSMIDEYNNDSSIFVFLLTTKVGGLGINLTGADRVLIFDPDWNPTVDTQARERAWRIGQQREVTVYRLITRGTIEEKIYHRQIFKQFLSNKVLRNPKQRRLFRSSDLRDLFSLDEHALDANPETAELFPEAEVKADQQGQRNTDRRSNGAANNNARRGDDNNAREKESNEGAEPDRKALMASVIVSPSSADDAAVVQQLLGVSSRLEHDAIMDRERHEARLVQVEAERVAARAAAALRADQQRIGRGGGVTWTGSAGNAGMPPALRGGAASRAVLTAIDPNSAEHHVLLPPLVSFLQARGGVADSESIVEAFKARVPPAELAVFRQLLRHVATFDARKKSWRLMDEFARR